jgi:hypothetical protein
MFVKEIDEGTILVLPLATIIETGNHIAQSPNLRYEKAQELAQLPQFRRRLRSEKVF